MAKYFQKTILCFIIGFVIGWILAVIIFKLNFRESLPLYKPSYQNSEYLYSKWFKTSGLEKKLIFPDEASFSGRTNLMTESKYLFLNVSVICVVIVENEKNAYAIANTWGKKCNQIVFFGKKKNKYLKIRGVKDGTSWDVLCQAFDYIWDRYRYRLQWVLFTHDNIFVIPENLRFVLSTKDFSKPFYIGHNAKFWNQVYNDGKAGFVLSKGAVDMFMKKFDSLESCKAAVKYNNRNDYYLGIFFDEMGVNATDMVDAFGKERLHAFTPAQLLAPGSFGVLQKYSKQSIHPVSQGFNCCSKTTVSFQGTERDLIYLYDYLLYKVKLFIDGNKGNKKSSTYTYSDEVWKKVVKEDLHNIDPNLVSSDDYYKLWTLKVSSPEEFNKQLKKLIMSQN